MTPGAILKARSIAKLATHCGAPHSEFQVAITVGEAYELLDYLLEQHPKNKRLREDVLEAKANSDPWSVVSNFRLMGFDITPVECLN